MSFNWTYVDNVTSSTLTSSQLWSLNYSAPEMALLTAILATMIAVTACGNALVCVALVQVQSLRSVSNLLIGNLAVSDFLLAVIVLPLSTINECLGRWPLGAVACSVWLTVDVLCCTASIWNLCMIAVDRCTAIVYPLWYRNKRSVCHAVPYVAAIWIVSLAVSVSPSLIGSSEVYVVDDDLQVHQCVLYQSPAYVMFSASASFFIPFTITVVLYIRIFTLLLRRMSATSRTTVKQSTAAGVDVTRRCRLVAELSTRQLPDGASVSEDVHSESLTAGMTLKSRARQFGSHHKLHLSVPSATATTSLTPHSQLAVMSSSCQRQRARRMTMSAVSDVHAVSSHRVDRREVVVSVRMAVIVVVFGGMWLGFFVVYVLRSWCSACYVPRQLDAFFFWLGYANSTVNPLLYTIFNADFRRAFRNILAACRRRANC